VNWNKKGGRATIFGDIGNQGRSRSVNLSGAAQRWNPRTYTYYEHQWQHQQGAFGDPEETQTRLEDDTEAVTEAFASRGQNAGLREAKRRGLHDAAKVYLKIRKESEEDLSARLARIRAGQIKHPTLRGKLTEAFVLSRLEQVRDAGAKGHTPAQAVADLPEVPRKSIPRWVTYTALALSIVSFGMNLRSRNAR